MGKLRCPSSSEWLLADVAEWTEGTLRVPGGFTWRSNRKVRFPDSVAVCWAEIDRVDQQRGSRWVVGTVIGALAGLAGAVGFTVLYCKTADDQSDLCGLAIIPGLIVGVPGGALAGGLLGLATPRWRPLYCGKAE